MYKNDVERLSRLLMAFCLVFSCTLVFAQETDEEEAVTGRESLAGCELSEGAMQPTRECMQYVSGLVQTVVMLQHMDPGEILFCIDPTVISLVEVTNSVTSWLKKVPARLDEEAYILVSEALNSSYPCPTGDVI